MKKWVAGFALLGAALFVACENNIAICGAVIDGEFTEIRLRIDGDAQGACERWIAAVDADGREATLISWKGFGP